MRSAPAKPRSIAAQLVFSSTVISALTLCFGLGVLYWIATQHAFEEDNHVLADKVYALRAHINKAGGPEGLSEELQAIHGGERSAYWVRVSDPDGTTVAQTPGMDDLLPFSAFQRVNGGTATNSSPRRHRVAGKMFALVATTQKAADGRLYTIQVGQDRSLDVEFTRRFGLVLAGVLAIGIVASAVSARKVMRRGLRPVAEMTQAVQRIEATHLTDRVAPAGWPPELQPLAIAFDAMLHRLDQSFTRLSQFSADLAHELRTPVANIRGEAEVSLRRARTADEYRSVVESSLGECERLSGIIDSLLFLARAEGAERQVTHTQFNARAAVEQIASYFSTIAEERNITITCSGEGEVDGDASLFSRAVSNLVDNSLRYTPDGGRILISVTPRADGCEISVSDTGSGVSETDLPHIFDRFYRADSSRSSHGVGLGLALVKSIIDLHGGSVAARSRVEEGTTITLHFPATDASRAEGTA